MIRLIKIPAPTMNACRPVLSARCAQRSEAGKATGCFADYGNSFAGDLGRVYRNAEAGGILIGIGI